MSTVTNADVERAPDQSGAPSGEPLLEVRDLKKYFPVKSGGVVRRTVAHVQAVDGVWVDLNDSQGLLGFAKQSRQLGFTGMSCIHPSQVEAINMTFSPTAEEIDYCQKVLQAFEEANARWAASS